MQFDNEQVDRAAFTGVLERGYFRQLCSVLPGRKDVVVVAVSHLVDNARYFLPAIDSLFHLGLVLPKPKSINEAIKAEISAFKSLSLSREWAGNAKKVLQSFTELGWYGTNCQILLVDIGGYFQPSIVELRESLGSRLLGVVEGTENGLKKYERLARLPLAVYTVARSPLKYPENHLIGVSVVFSVEAILRSQAQVLQGRRACVIGFGKVGRSIAGALRDNGIPTVVHDTDSIALAEASARGFEIFRFLEPALRNANLVLCATGNISLGARGFADLRDGTYVATVTSGDDELDLNALRNGFISRPISDRIEMFDDGQKTFFLINGGNAVNFVHGAVVGPAIQLIEGEKLACLSALATGQGQSAGILELDRPTREFIASVWLDHFASGK